MNTIQHSKPLFLISLTGFVFCIVAIFLSAAPLARAQFQPPMGGGPQFEIDPRYPEPGEAFTIRFADYTSPTSGGLEWFVDGVRQTAQSGRNTLSLTAPELGTPLIVEVRKSTSLGATQSVRTTITPQAVDLIFEGETMAPYFYAGRRVPSTGSRTHIVGIPHIFNAKGQRISAKELSYSWNINNELIQTGKGDLALDVTLSNIGDSMVTLSVDAIEEGVHYEKSFYIPTTEPLLAFYTQNALAGLSRNTIRDGYFLAKDEVTVRAEPYFVSDSIYQDAQYGWTIDNTPTSNNNADPQIITLQKNGEGVVSDISFSVQNLRALSQSAAGLFQLAFE